MAPTQHSTEQRSSGRASICQHGREAAGARRVEDMGADDNVNCSTITCARRVRPERKVCNNRVVALVGFEKFPFRMKTCRKFSSMANALSLEAANEEAIAVAVGALYPLRWCWTACARVAVRPAMR